ncbi:MAG TPA: ATP-binding cassette domain-containing protein, partial [Dongiaceae bacterium]|nr:ATP-binding cassette domain-containing protein [Dongiaceae bacterium]
METIVSLPPRIRTDIASFRPAPAEPGEAASTPRREIRLATRDFDLFYGAHQAIKGVTLEIETNSVTAIIGPSGCGKSTLLRAFNRMNDLIPSVRTRGEVRVSGRNVLAADTDVVELRRRVGMVFQ